ncbi:hypothetical protein ONZ43_g4255 [Nemania bipapillata]|uniref:Uncharacterized protein n=1 Tax=Nemania bipapillata TaxID=110536 RepID=A0ACC2IPY1_9PEZI|nr:hypothetical protein ONZ43_g4255 [Nemania bipapillata]
MSKPSTSSSSNPFAEPPPAYSATEDGGSTQVAGQASGVKTFAISTEELRQAIINNPNPEGDPFVFLQFFDTVFLIDDSGSMKIKDSAGGESRWEQTRDLIEQLVPICMRYDQDGIDIYFLNDPDYLVMEGHANDPHKNEPCWSWAGNKDEGKAAFGYIGVTDQEHVRRIFDGRKPGGGTPTGRRLGGVMGTVSAPQYQAGVQFVQVGRDQKAAAFLQRLDDDLTKKSENKELRDMVDCVPYTAFGGEAGAKLTPDMILKVTLGAVKASLDRQQIKDGLLQEPGRARS